MAASKLPAGSSPSSPGEKPRAQVSYEGADEFSAMSLDPRRKKQLKTQEKLITNEKEKPQPDELKRVNDQGVVTLFRKIFAK